MIHDAPGRGNLRVSLVGSQTRSVASGALRHAGRGDPPRHRGFAGWIFEGPRRFDIMLLLPPASLTPEAFGELAVGTPTDQLSLLAQVADIRESEGPAVINRESLSRRVLVEANVHGRDLVSFVAEAQDRAAAKIKLPEGVHLEWGGQFENFERASKRLGLVVTMAHGVTSACYFSSLARQVVRSPCLQAFRLR